MCSFPSALNSTSVSGYTLRIFFGLQSQNCRFCHFTESLSFLCLVLPCHTFYLDMPELWLDFQKEKAVEMKVGEWMTGLPFHVVWSRGAAVAQEIEWVVPLIVKPSAEIPSLQSTFSKRPWAKKSQITPDLLFTLMALHIQRGRCERESSPKLLSGLWILVEPYHGVWHTAL